MEILKFAEDDFPIKCTYHYCDLSKIPGCMRHIREFSKINGLPVYNILGNDGFWKSIFF